MQCCFSANELFLKQTQHRFTESIFQFIFICIYFFAVLSLLTIIDLHLHDHRCNLSGTSPRGERWSPASTTATWLIWTSQSKAFCSCHTLFIPGFIAKTSHKRWIEVVGWLVGWTSVLIKCIVVLILLDTVNSLIAGNYPNGGSVGWRDAKRRHLFHLHTFSVFLT